MLEKERYKSSPQFDRFQEYLTWGLYRRIGPNAHNVSRRGHSSVTTPEHSSSFATTRVLPKNMKYAPWYWECTMNCGSWDHNPSQDCSNKCKDQLHMLCNSLPSHQQPQKKATIAFFLALCGGVPNNALVGFWRWSIRNGFWLLPGFIFIPRSTPLHSVVAC